MCLRETRFVASAVVVVGSAARAKTPRDRNRNTRGRGREGNPRRGSLSPEGLNCEILTKFKVPYIQTAMPADLKVSQSVSQSPIAWGWVGVCFSLRRSRERSCTRALLYNTEYNTLQCSE